MHIRPKAGDGLIYLVLLLFTVLSFFAGYGQGTDAACAVIRTDTETTEVSLDENRTLRVTGADGIVMTVIIEDGSVRAEESTCPDRLCVRSGRIRRPGQSIICLPARICITVRGGKEQDHADIIIG